MVSFSSGGDAGVLIKGCDRQPGQLFASLGWGILGPARSEVLSVKEKRTGVEFDGEFCYRRGQHNCPKITGAG